MTDENKGAPAPRRKPAAPRAGAKPAWMNALRSLYDDALSEQVPDDLARLLEQLDESKPAKSSEKGDA